MEIKCPYSAKDALVHEIPERQRSYLVVDGNDAKLLRNHHYFKQVMMQMFVCKRSYCDFVVWTQKDVFIERVMLDQELCNKIVDKCALYFERVLLPEHCFRYWTTAAEEAVVEQSAGSQDDKYCYCQQPEYGDMIRCDGKHCTRQWFHFQCVNLKRAPKSRKWYCTFITCFALRTHVSQMVRQSHRLVSAAHTNTTLSSALTFLPSNTFASKNSVGRVLLRMEYLFLTNPITLST